MKPNISQKEWQLMCQALDEKNENYRWIVSNYQKLQEEYEGQVIAVYEQEVIYSAKDLTSLLKQIPQKDSRIDGMAFERIFKKAG